MKLTLRATRSEPAGVAVALLGRRGRAAVVDARALNTAVRVVQALLLVLALRAVIETIAPAPAQQVTPVTAAVLPVDLPVENLPAGKEDRDFRAEKIGKRRKRKRFMSELTSIEMVGIRG